jgi:phage portal protein BeeE
MRNATVKRCVNLIANAIGMLPFPLLKLGSDGSRDKATDHPLYDLLTARPNSRHTAFEFRRLMQRWLLIDGNAYALIVSSRGRVTSLVPLPPSRVQVRERPDWTIEYKVRGRGRGFREVTAARYCTFAATATTACSAARWSTRRPKCWGCRCAPTRRPRGCSATARSPGPCSNRTSS